MIKRLFNRVRNKDIEPLSKRLPDTQACLDAIRAKADKNFKEFNSGAVCPLAGVVVQDLNERALSAKEMDQYRLFESGLQLSPVSDNSDDVGTLIHPDDAKVTIPAVTDNIILEADKLLSEISSTLTLEDN